MKGLVSTIDDRPHFPQSRLEDLILFKQNLVLGEQDPAFFKQLVSIQSGNLFVFIHIGGSIGANRNSVL
jgi:hypothetical protein